MFVSSVNWARQEHEKCLDMSPEEQAGMERTFVLGSINPVPQAPDKVTAHMRVDLLEAVPKFLREKMTRSGPSGTHQVQSILFFIMKTLLTSSEYSRIGIAKDVLKYPRNGIPRDIIQAILWLEDIFNRYTVAMTVKVMLEPKEVLAFVYGIVKHSFAQDIEMNMGWIEMKNKFQVMHKAFDHVSLEALLRELIVKLRMRRSNAGVDSALGVTSMPNSKPGATSLEADASEARTPPKKATTPPKNKAVFIVR
eukprot:3361981-Amphidinium_carterae.3